MLRNLILIALVYFAYKSVRNVLSKVKIVPRDGVEIKDQGVKPSHKLRVDESEIEDADFKDVE